MADSEAPRERPKLNLKPRDPEAAKLAELERQKSLSKNPFGAAKPREAVLSEKLGKSEEEILKEEAKKQRPHLRLSLEQIAQRKEKEASIAEVESQVASEEDPKKKELLLTELASRQDELDQLLDGFEKLALEKAAKGEVARPSERRATLEQQQPPARAAGGGGGFGNGYGYGSRDDYRGGSGGGRGGQRGDYDYNGRGGGGGRGGYQRSDRDSYGSRDSYSSYGKDDFGSGYGGSRAGGGSFGGGFGGSYGSGGFDKPDRYEKSERSGGFGSGGGYQDSGSGGFGSGGGYSGGGSGGGYNDSGRGRGRGRGRSSDGFGSGGFNSRGGYGSTYEEPDYHSPYTGQDRF